jgi:hypothetical protein
MSARGAARHEVTHEEQPHHLPPLAAMSLLIASTFFFPANTFLNQLPVFVSHCSVTLLHNDLT